MSETSFEERTMTAPITSKGPSPAASVSKVEPEPLVPKYFDVEDIVTPSDNVVDEKSLEQLIESIRQHSQLLPGWVCPSPDIPASKRLCLEGNRRSAVCRRLGRKFWAFDLGRFVPEHERIALLFQHNHSRRVMSREEIAARAARFIELTSCTDAEAAKQLAIHPVTLSRAFGELRIPASLRERAKLLAPSIRSAIAAAPAERIEEALEFAEKPGASGRKPTRDEVVEFVRGLRQDRARRPKTITVSVAGRTISFSLVGDDSAAAVIRDLKSVSDRLAKHPDVAIEAWPFLFRSVTGEQNQKTQGAGQ